MRRDIYLGDTTMSVHPLADEPDWEFKDGEYSRFDAFYLAIVHNVLLSTYL